MSKFSASFKKAAGRAAVAAVVTLGVVTPITLASIYTNPAAEQAAASNHNNPQPIDAYFNFITPLFPQARYDASIGDNEVSLDSTSTIYKVEANNSQDAIADVVAGVRDTIISNGGQLNRIVISGDGATNGIANPIPNSSCDISVGLPDYTTFCTTKITDILHALVVLQGQDFPGHKAGEPLAKALDMISCDIFQAVSYDGTILPAKEFSQLATQLNMPIIASATEVGYFVDPTGEKVQQVGGDFIAMLPDGNVAYLNGPYYDFGESIEANEAWIAADGFTVEKIAEPVANHPFSVTQASISAKAATPPAAPNAPKSSTPVRPSRAASLTA